MNLPTKVFVDTSFFVALLNSNDTDHTHEVIPSSPQLFAQALSMFSERSDKEWGLTDCSSFVIMQESGLSVALTADHHFQQAGFRAALLEPSSEP